MIITGTSGDDRLTGSGGADEFDLSQGGRDRADGRAGDDLFRFGAAFTAGDRVVGGAGFDIVSLVGDYFPLGLGAHALEGIEEIDLGGSSTYLLRMDDGNVRAGKTLSVIAEITGGAQLIFKGRAETDGHFAVTGSVQDDVLFGGQRGDTLTGGSGHDNIHGGGGADLIIGGVGADMLTGGKGADTFVYSSILDTRVAFRDLIHDLHKADIIDLSAIDADSGQDGDQAFAVVSAFTGHAGEAVLSYDAAFHRTSLSLDVDGDGAADGEILMDGRHTAFDHFVL